jgi:hypothetical protein
MNRRERAKASQKAWVSRNLDYVRGYQKEWAKKNRASKTAAQRTRRGVSGITREAPGNCECCGVELVKNVNCDHDHETGKFRGWLCSKCNLGIGLLGDTLESVLRAVDYLMKS